MPDREWFYDEALTEQTTTSTSFVDIMETEFNPKAGETWLLMASFLQKGRDAATTSVLQWMMSPGGIFHTTTYRPREGTNTSACLFFAVQTYGSDTPVTSVMSLKVLSGISRGQVKDIRLFGLKLTNNDKFAHNLGDAWQSTTSTSWEDYTTLTFTPPTAGNYLILASCGVQNQATNRVCKTVLDVAGTEMCEGAFIPYSSGNEAGCWVAIHRANLTASSKTIRIRYSSSSPSRSVEVHSGCIIALRLPDFDDEKYGSADSRTTTNATTLQNKLTVNESFENGAWLFLATALWDVSGTSSNYFGIVAARFGAIQHTEGRERLNNTGNIRSFGTLAYQPSYKGDDKFSVWYGVHTSSLTIGLSYTRIAALNLGAPSAAGQPYRKRLGGVPHTISGPSMGRGGVW